jgi:hypothetical protein
MDDKRLERWHTRTYDSQIHLDSGPIDWRCTVEHAISLVMGQHEQGVQPKDGDNTDAVLI